MIRLFAFRSSRQVFLLFVALAAVASARAETFKIEPVRSSITFKVRHFLGTVDGKFKNFSGEIELDRERPEESSVRAAIQVRSIDTGIGKRDEHMCGPDFFDTTKFPEITFKSGTVRRTGKNTGDVVGEFTMHGVSRSVPLHVTFLGFGKNAGGVETTRWKIVADPLKRNDYGLRWSDSVERISMISQEVAISMEIEATSAGKSGD